MGWIRKAVVAVAIVTCLTLTGCSIPAGGDAIIVGDERISQTHLDAAIADVYSVLAGNPSFSSSRIVQITIQDEILGALLDQTLPTFGVVITDTERDTYVSQNAGSSDPLYMIYNTNDGRRVIVGEVDRAIAQEKANNGQFAWDELEAAMSQIRVQVNPRYGQWVGDASFYGSLATPKVFAMPS